MREEMVRHDWMGKEFRPDRDAARGPRSLDIACCPLRAVRMVAMRLPFARRNIMFTAHLAHAQDHVSISDVAGHTRLQMGS